jgi:hypothetical protein
MARSSSTTQRVSVVLKRFRMTSVPRWYLRPGEPMETWLTTSVRTGCPSVSRSEMGPAPQGLLPPAQ